ncbi:MAG: YCF48-related protein [Planctomycetota bacterium]|jgi:photosystem II stability/assembly factor-like uncharacterized protein
MRYGRFLAALLAAGASPAWAASWYHLNSGTTETLDAIQFPVDATTGYAVGGHGVILKTTDGGMTWIAQDSGITDAALFSLHFPVDELTGYVVGAYGSALKTTDGGATWVPMDPGTSDNLREVRFPEDATTGYIVGDNGTILKTTDGGVNWVPQTSGTNEDLLSMDFLDDWTGYAVGWWGTIVKTTDGGADWNSQDSDTTQVLHDVCFPADATTGYIVGSSGTLIKTTDGGSNWNPEPLDQPLTTYTVHFPVDAATGWFGATGGGLYKLEDATWAPQDSGTDERIYDLHFPVDEVVGYAVGWRGVMLKTTDGGGSRATLHPSADGATCNFTSAVGCPAGDWDCVNDQTGNGASGLPETHDDTTSYLYDAKDAGGRAMFSLADGIVPAGAVVTGITIQAWVGKGTGGPAPEASLSYERVGIDSGPVDGAAESITTSGIGQSMSASWSCLNWTGTDMDALEIGIYHVSGAQLNISQIYLTVSYDIQGTVYRSIGTESAALYSDGDATVAAGSRNVTLGNGALLPPEVGRGDRLTVNGDAFHIVHRLSDTEVIVQETPCSDATAAAYTISRAYNTLQAWEIDRQGDLVADGRNEIGVVYNDGTFTGQLTIDGSTTDADHCMNLTVAEGHGHNGLKNTGAAIDASALGTANAIDVKDEYTRIEGLEIKGINNTGSAIFLASSPAADDSVVSKIFVHSCVQWDNAGVDIGAQNVAVRNSFFTGGTTFGIRVLANASAVIENSTIVGDPTSGTGVGDSSGSTVSIKNTISVNHAAGNDFALWDTILFFGNNMYSTALGIEPTEDDGGHQAPPGSLEALFASLSGEDFHLDPSGHNAGDTGLDLSASFTDDIDGETRSGLWEIGADDGGSFAGGGGGTTPKVVGWREIEP